jgi:hypothetical protein
MRSIFLRLLTTGTPLLLAGACADDPNVPPAGVPGAYHATSFTATSGGPVVNLLAAGATLSMTLADDHTTSGRLTVPASVDGGMAIDESLAGSWRQSRDTVYFDGPADTFIRDVPFVIRGATLAADEVAPEVHLQVTLSKE